MCTVKVEITLAGPFTKPFCFCQLKLTQVINSAACIWGDHNNWFYLLLEHFSVLSGACVSTPFVEKRHYLKFSMLVSLGRKKSHGIFLLFRMQIRCKFTRNMCVCFHFYYLSFIFTVNFFQQSAVSMLIVEGRILSFVIWNSVLTGFWIMHL